MAGVHSYSARTMAELKAGIDEVTASWLPRAIAISDLNVQGETLAAKIGSILKEEPQPIRALKPDAPYMLERLISHCLNKDADKRPQTARDVRNELDEIKDSLEAEEVIIKSDSDQLSAEQTRSGTLRPPVIFAGAVLVFLTALTVWFTAERRLKQPSPTERQFQFPMSATAGNLFGEPAISPDGKLVAYPYESRLRIRDLERGTSWPIPDTEGAVYPFWSPDGNFIGYERTNARWQISFNGGMHPRWSSSGDALFFVEISDEGNNLMAVKVDTEHGFRRDEPVRLFNADQAGIVLTRPGVTLAFIPNYDVASDGQHFVAVRHIGGDVDAGATLHIVLNLQVPEK